MKKMFICCGVLCMALLLFCGTALAAVEVKPGDDASVTVEKDAEEKVFKVTKTGVTDGQLYLVMIQKGDANAKPTAENLYYLNVDKASSATFTMDAYPKDLDEGTYVVYLSDYANSNGGRKAVATLSVTDPNHDVLYGDVDGNGKVKSWDATVLACYLAGQSEFQNINLQNADCNGDGKVKSWDLTVLYCHLAGQSEFAQLPYKGN